MSEKILVGYEAAAAVTGLSKRQLQLMVARRAIRVIRLSGRSRGFWPSELFADIRALTVPKRGVLSHEGPSRGGTVAQGDNQHGTDDYI